MFLSLFQHQSHRLTVNTLAAAVNKLVAEEKTVMAQRIVPENIKYRQLLKLNGKEVDVLENND